MLKESNGVTHSAWRRRGANWPWWAHLLVVGGMMVGVTAGPVEASNRDPHAVEPVDLAELSLDELMNMPVTSVSKKEERYSQTAAALFVLTQEDIRRSGATSIPEALRMVPGLQVAKLDGNKWAITARGFNGRFANKLLVLVDGRTVYSPTFAGVNWDQQDMILEDIERIEVIRGPGATLWGVNAVNGVINIITKKARDTQGGLVVAGGGTEDRGFTGLRYGVELAEDTHLRVYGKFFARDNQAQANGDPASDRWHQSRAGMRLDHTATNGDLWTLQGDYFAGQYRESVIFPTLASPYAQRADLSAQTTGGNLLGRWTHTFSATSGVSVQAYYDRVEIYNARAGLISDQADLNLQHHTDLGSRHQLLWGVGYRFVNNQTITQPGLLSATYSPETRWFSVWSGFIQDEITLVPQSVTATVGTKLEHNDFTGFVVQPSLKLRWTPDERQTIWGAVSRAVRAPSHSEDDIQVYQPTGTYPPVAVFGSRRGGNENLLAYEAGYRRQVTPDLSVDIAAYYNNYSDLRTFEPGSVITVATPPPAHPVQPLYWQNQMDGETYGVETWLEWRPTAWWRIQPSYSYLHMRLFAERSLSATSANAKGVNPAHQASIRSLMSLPYTTELDVWVRYVDRLPAVQIPAYTTMDVRVGWKPTRRIELSLVGQNLLDRRRPEFRESIVSFVPTEIQRAAYAKVTWRW